MQYSSPELYEAEKESNKGTSIGVLYHQKYKLSGNLNRFYNLNLTNFIFENTNDKILVYLNYTTYDNCGAKGYGRLEYDFYVVENSGQYYVQYFDMRDVQSIAATCGKTAISNLAYCHEIFIGSKTAEYKDYIRKNCMSPRIPLDKTVFDNMIDGIASTDFSDSFLDYVNYLYKTTCVEMLDFVNKITFYSDEYVVPKYLACIQFVEFLFDTCKIPFLNKCNLKSADSIETAMELLVDKTLRQKYHI